VEVPVVTLDVVARTQNGDIIPGLKKENFRVLEDGQPQTITNFGPTRRADHHGGADGIQRAVLWMVWLPGEVLGECAFSQT